jgi:hypothetical protein
MIFWLSHCKLLSSEAALPVKSTYILHNFCSLCLPAYLSELPACYLGLTWTYLSELLTYSYQPSTFSRPNMKNNGTGCKNHSPHWLRKRKPLTSHDLNSPVRTRQSQLGQNCLYLSASWCCPVPRGGSAKVRRVIVFILRNTNIIKFSS